MLTPVSFAGLPDRDRLVARVNLAALVAASGLVVIHALKLFPLPLAVVLHAVVQPAAALIAVLVLGAGLAALATGALKPGGPPAALALLFVALILAAIGSTMLQGGSALAIYSDLLPGRSLVPGWLVLTTRIAGWVSVACASGVALMGVARRLRQPVLAFLFALLPPAAFAVIFLLVSWLAKYPTLLTLYSRAHPAMAIAHPNSWFLSGAALTLSSVSGALAGLVAWRVIAGVDATRTIAAARARSLARRRDVVLGVVALKLVWLGLGLSGLLWPALGGDAPGWRLTRGQGLAGWLLAALTALLAAGWLARGARAVRERRLEPVAGGLSLGLVWPFVVGAFGLLGIFTYAGVAGTNAPQAARDLISWIGDRGVNAPRLPIIVAGVIAVIAVARRRLPSWAVLLALFTAWSLPVFIASFTGEYSGAPYVFGASTLDVCLTTVLAGCLIWAYRARATRLQSAIVLVLLVSTVLAWSHAISSGLIGQRATNDLSLLIPILWTFGFAARQLNKHGPTRQGTLLAALGLATVTLALAAYQLTAGGPGPATFGPIISALVTPPLAAVLVAATVSAWRGHQPRHQRSHPQRIES